MVFFSGQDKPTMDTGEGGCNDNAILDNDFSYAPTNGVEVTFSRNRISGNRIFECDHGIWGGYSFNSKITGNKFRNNRIAVAIEHGQHNDISYNIFYGDREGVKLWARKEQPSDWGYAKYRDTRSVDYSIAMNSFNKNAIGISVTRSDSLKIFGNTFSDVAIKLKSDSSVLTIDSTESELVDTTLLFPSVKNPINPFQGNAKYAGRSNIMITEWGPYDFRYPIIWNNNPTDTSEFMNFRVLGPRGEAKLILMKGVSDPVDTTSGNYLPDDIFCKKISGKENDIEIVMEYKGVSFTDPFGNIIPANKPYRFSFKKYFQPINWEVLFYSLDTAHHNPIETGTLFSMVEKKAPFKTEKVNKLDYAWWGGIKEAGVNYPQFITVAAGNAEIPKGDYELSVTWDDAVQESM
jgi:parallel beta-helix repeat protein